MTDEPENLTLKLLREMRAELKERDEKIAAELSAIRAETAHIPGIAAEVAALGVQAEDIKESINIIEHDISAMKLRIERIEKHTGLVKT